uniref:Uncharacterized protein n=1 Tax=Tanacetum cinerariifolium TaxID=118510 RepID=A0A6L2NXJ4_TANCI|nr:hypothetical protein [Tanacetum cinerariifolium]
MVTRFRIGTNRPTKRLNLHVSSVSRLPKSYRDAFSDPNWQNAIRYKARLVANGSTQLERVDVDETFITVIKPEDYYIITSGVCYDRSGSAQLFSSLTPIDTESKQGSDGDPVFDQTLYRSLAGSLQILRYVRGTLDYGLQLFSPSTTYLVAYFDADWVGCPTTRRSTSGYFVFLGNNLLSWSSKRQPTLSRSSAKAEYCGVANVVRVLHVPSRYQFADISTKCLPSTLFEGFRSSLSVRCPPAPTAGEC